ncbi:hypothetical protein H0H93_009981, partial [Arthromyces matolae]
MVSRRRYFKVASARARAHALLAQQGANPTVVDSPQMEPMIISSDSDSETAYRGGVNHYSSTSDDKTDSQGGDDGLESLSEFSEEEVAKLEQRHMLYDQIQVSKTKKEWKKLEAMRGLGYNGLLERNIRLKAQKAHENHELREKSKV